MMLQTATPPAPSFTETADGRPSATRFLDDPQRDFPRILGFIGRRRESDGFVSDDSGAKR